MGKIRIDKRNTRDPLLKVKFLVEGATEKFYFKNLLNDIGYRLHIDIESLDGGGYSTFIEKINKNKSIYDIIIIISDLDRTYTHPKEKEYLKKLIFLLENLNLKKNIFLTYENIETWLESTFDKKVSNLTTELGYSNSSKGKEDIYERLNAKHAFFSHAIPKFKKENLYYLKINFEKGSINENNILKRQSNLIYFIAYLKDELKVLS